ncbi:2-aminoethylphosphonate aminotransferase [Ekhidna sp.]|uniref:2-aminoethylphosphonate aminotransferase n=1 Tax=Ekhidna sp. TaxID=2608089 RepID=UPI0032979D2A
MLHKKELDRKILLNPGPATTSQRVKEAQLISDICPREGEFGQVMHDICDGILKVGNGQETHRVSLFGASGTGAMEACLVSALGKEDHALIITNGAYGIRMKSICDGYGLKSSTLFEFGDYPEPAKIKETLSSGAYTHLIMVHHETSTGMLDPLEEVAQICQGVGVKFIVDAMSSYGAYPIDLAALHIDYLFSSSNKCIHGMAGLSFVIFHKDRTEDLKANGTGFYFDVYKQWDNLQKKDQLRFTPPVQTSYAFLEAIKEHEEEGIENRWNRYQSNWQKLYDGFKHLGFTFFLPEEQQSKILLAINLDRPGLNFNDFHDYLYENGITIYPGVIPESKTFRVAVIGELYEEDMDYVMDKVRAYFQ